MVNVTLTNLAFIAGLVLLAGSMLGSVTSFLRRMARTRAAAAEARRFAAGGYERPIGWPEPAWSSGPVPTRAYRTADPAPRSDRRRITRVAAVCCLAFGGTTVGLNAYNGALPLRLALGKTPAAVGCPAALVPADSARCIRFSARLAPAQVYGLSEKLSETRLTWPETLRSR